MSSSIRRPFSLLAAGCFVLGFSSARAAGCEAENARFVVGKPYLDALAEQARRKAGAAIIRRMERGMAYTMEFRDDRLDLVVDKKGVIASVHCG